MNGLPAQLQNMTILSCEQQTTVQMLPLLCVSASAHRDSPPGSRIHHRFPHLPWLQQQGSAGRPQEPPPGPAASAQTGVALWPRVRVPLQLELLSPADSTSWRDVRGCCRLFLHRLQFLVAIRTPDRALSFLCPGWSFLHFLTWNTVAGKKRKLLTHSNMFGSHVANADHNCLLFASVSLDSTVFRPLLNAYSNELF